MKMMFRITISTMAPAPSRIGERHQASSPGSTSSARSSVRVRRHTKPSSSSSDFGLVTIETATVTTASARKAMIACQKLPLSSEPKWKITP